MSSKTEKNFPLNFLDVSDYQNSDATNKVNRFPSQNTSISVLFGIELLMEEIEIVVAAEFKSETRAKTNQSASLEHSAVKILIKRLQISTSSIRMSLQLKNVRFQPP